MSLWAEIQGRHWICIQCGKFYYLPHRIFVSIKWVITCKGMIIEHSKALNTCWLLLSSLVEVTVNNLVYEIVKVVIFVYKLTMLFTWPVKSFVCVILWKYWVFTLLNWSTWLKFSDFWLCYCFFAKMLVATRGATHTEY